MARANALLSSSSAAFGFISFKPCARNDMHIIEGKTSLKSDYTTLLNLPADLQFLRLSMVELPPLSLALVPLVSLTVVLYLQLLQPVFQPLQGKVLQPAPVLELSLDTPIEMSHIDNVIPCYRFSLAVDSIYSHRNSIWQGTQLDFM